jgi:2-polyprenyl-3-methyl-5-hydroxy-6-metoxy-1,4-benzoquinol methylase
MDLDLIGADHVARYKYIAKRLTNLNRKLYGLDVFCGSGYGSKIIAENLDGMLLAIDGSEEAILEASKKINLSNLLFAHKLFPFDLPTLAFDFVVSLESIEHVKDYDAFFELIVGSLKFEGTLFISAPNETTMPYDGYIWHHKHFTGDEIRSMADKYNLEEISCFSTTCHLYKDGISSYFYPYQINNGTFLDENLGDTLFFEFRRK